MRGKDRTLIDHSVGAGLLRAKLATPKESHSGTGSLPIRFRWTDCGSFRQALTSGVEGIYRAASQQINPNQKDVARLESGGLLVCQTVP
jgi:hypothetical protein